MTYTVVTDDSETDRKIENVKNMLMRRCQIGKVTRKPPPDHLGWFSADFGIHITPQYSSDATEWLQRPMKTSPIRLDQQQYMSKCGCRVGNACGNAACPHMPVVC